MSAGGSHVGDGEPALTGLQEDVNTDPSLVVHFDSLHDTSVTLGRARSAFRPFPKELF